MDSESWPQDDPVYSEAACDAEDTYYFGSEDEEYNDPIERRERYEAAAQRFLSGEQSSILLSASLRGPFGYDQGWLNPWRSKPKRQLAASVPPSRSQKSKPRQSQHAKSSRIEKPSQTTQDSQVSHLPSPESLKQVEIEPHPFLEEEEVERLHRWQSTVPGAKEQDELTTNMTPSSYTSSQRKRRAKSSDWLKQPSSKKRRTAGAPEGESLKTPTRRPREATISGSSDRPQNSLTTPFRSSSLCPGDQDDDELGADDRSSQAVRSSFIKAQQLSPAKRMSPKRAMLKSNKVDSAESADELSQETAKDSQAAATLSSPVSMKDKSVAPAVLSTGSPAKKVRTTQKQNSQVKAPVIQHAASPFKKLRTPRMRKSRTRHRIEALRAPLPRPEKKSVEVHEADESAAPAEIEVTTAREKEPSSTQRSKIRLPSTQQKDKEQMPTQQEESVPVMNVEDSGASVVNETRHSEVEDLNTIEVAPEVRDSSPLSDISSSCGSVSWAGISSPESKASHPHATRTSTRSIPTASYEESEESEDDDEFGEPMTLVGKNTADTEMHATAEDAAEPATYELDPELHDLDSDSDASSDLSDISMRDIYLRNSSLARMDDLVPASEMDRLNAELDSDDEAAMDQVDEDPGSESDLSGYETAHSQHQSRETTPIPASAGHLLHVAGQEANASPSESPIQSVERDEPRTGPVDNTKDVAINHCDEVIPDSYDVTGWSTALGSMLEAPNVHSPAQSPSNIMVEAAKHEQDGSAQHIAPDTTSEVEVADQATVQEPVPLSSFDCALPDQTVNPQSIGLPAKPSTPPPSSPEQPFDPFADFMSPSPEKNLRQRRITHMHGSSLGSILKTAWSDPKPKKKVSFGPLPGEQANNLFSIADEQPDKERPASPPPQTSVEQLPTSSEADFQGHFNAMAKRAAARPPQEGHVSSSPAPASQQYRFGTQLAADKLSNSSEPSDSEPPAKSLFGAVGSENKPPSKSLYDFDDVFDNLSSMLRPYDLEAELDEARTGEMEGLGFGGW